VSGFADFMTGDATAAYTTYSEFNAPDWPFPGWDWSWGYKDANPVLRAHRTVIVVHGAVTPPYFVITDDIDKDGSPHDYQWRLHTPAGNTVDVSSNPIRIDSPTSALEVHALHPDFSSLANATQPYDNGAPEPDAVLLTLTHNAVNPRFSFLLFPSDSTVSPPAVTKEVHTWGYACRLDWGGGVCDIVIGNHSGGSVLWGPDSLRTDASLAIVRTNGSAVIRHLLVDATTFYYNGIEHVRFYDSAATCALAGDVIEVDRCDAVFRILDPGVEQIECRGEQVSFVRRSGYLLSDPSVSAGPAHPPSDLSVSVFPNPFNPTVTIRIGTPAKSPLRVSVYDAAGRLVRDLMDATTATGVTTLRWDGLNRAGRAVPSGVYFLKVSSAGVTRTHKLVVLK